jgi:uncharacterized protein
MPLLVNLRHLEAHDLRLKGKLPVAELDLDTRDEVIQVNQPLDYDLEVQKVEDGVLVQGTLRLTLQCECVRCLKSFEQPLNLGSWAALLALQGEDAVAIVSDCVDLTPQVREDILLELPQHPLCDPECQGLPKPGWGDAGAASKGGQSEPSSSAWSELNKLKF